MKVGVFATRFPFPTVALKSRTPHHPNPIGLTVAKLDKVEGCTVHLSSIDLIHGTPSEPNINSNTQYLI